MDAERYIEPLDLLRAFHQRDIRYLLIGRQALVLLGAPLLTVDYDFFLDPERAHVEALLVLARELDLEPTVRRPEDAPVFSLLSDTQKFDFFRATAYSTKAGETLEFAALWDRRRVTTIRDFEIWTPSLADLVRTKEIRGSPKDREDIKYLQVLIEREQQGGSTG